MPDNPLILPPLCRTAADAEAFARVVHAGQVDKAGVPYLRHLSHVFARVYMGSGFASGASGEDPACQMAWLHDVLEDTPYTGEDLEREGFSEDVVTGVGWLTRPKEMPYAAYIREMAGAAPLPAILVKIADIEDNSDPDRLALLPEEVQARLRAKYEPALVMLKDAAVARGWHDPKEAAPCP